MSETTPGAGRGRFTRRVLLLGGIQLAAFGGLLYRLHQMQIIDAEQYATLSEENRMNAHLVAPPRGQVYDRFGYLVASNRDNLKVIVVPEDAGELDDLLDRVSLIAPLEENERKKLWRRVKRQRAFVPVTIKENLSWAQFAQLNVEGPELPGVRPEAGYSRRYHFGRELAHILGYVGPVNEWEGADNPLLLIPGFEIGKAGVEDAHDEKLRGKPGIRQVEINAGGRIIRELDRSPSTPGDDIVLTVDLELQRYALDRLQGENAAAVVMDVHTGEVLASASSPSFDPNQFSGGMTAAQWRTLVGDPDKPLLNRTMQGQYPPGSTFKMVVALAALESGLISPRDRVHCPGRYYLGKQSFGCWKKSGHGSMDLHNGLKFSCDCYFYEVARQIGIDRIAAMARKLGLGETYDADHLDAKAGLIPTPGWKQATQGQVWFPGETVIAGIGQGYVLATPLQLAVYASRLATGKAIRPRMVRSIGDTVTLAEDAEPLDIDEASLAVVRKAMDAVVNQGGTAARSRFDVEGARMAGKTGTSQVRSLTAQVRAEIARDGGKVPKKFEDHALFVAFTPVEAPRYAIAVVVEHGGGGSKAAAPVAKDILMKTLEFDVAGIPAFEPATVPGRTAEDDTVLQDG